MASTPKTLQAAIIFFADKQNCHEFMVNMRWPEGTVACPRCGSENVKYSEKYNRWQCGSHHERRQFTLKTGTIFEESPLGLDKWLPCVWLVVNCKNGISSHEVARSLGVTQKTAWFMLHRIRLMLQGDDGGMLGGDVEVDETYIGGKARNMHTKRRRKLATMQTGRVEYGKTVVMGMLERSGRVRTRVVSDAKRRTLEPHVRENIAPGATVMTDEAPAYTNMLASDFVHHVINHAERYVDGQIHTNGIENFWSLLKRGLAGTYVSVQPYHLFRYLDEQAFRYNNRKDFNDSDRFVLAMTQAVGKRLTYAEVTGKVGETVN